MKSAILKGSLPVSAHRLKKDWCGIHRIQVLDPSSIGSSMGRTDLVARLYIEKPQSNCD